MRRRKKVREEGKNGGREKEGRKEEGRKEQANKTTSVTCKNTEVPS
jgi:hypothetical protein